MTFRGAILAACGRRAAHAFDGTRFLAGGAMVLVEGDRIVGVETGRVDVPDGIEVSEYAGTVLPGLIDCHTHLVADATFGGLERAGRCRPRRSTQSSRTRYVLMRWPG